MDDQSNLPTPIRGSLLTGYFIRCAEERFSGRSANTIDPKLLGVTRSTKPDYEKVSEIATILWQKETLALGEAIQPYLLIPLEDIGAFMEVFAQDVLAVLVRDQPHLESRKDELTEWVFLNMDYGYCWRVAEELVAPELHTSGPLREPSATPRKGKSKKRESGISFNPSPPVSGSRLPVQRGILVRIFGSRSQMPSFTFSSEGVRCGKPHYLRNQGDHFALIMVLHGPRATEPGYQALALLQRSRCPACPTENLIAGACSCCKGKWDVSAPESYMLSRTGDLKAAVPAAMPTELLVGLQEDLLPEEPEVFDTRDPGYPDFF